MHTTNGRVHPACSQRPPHTRPKNNRILLLDAAEDHEIKSTHTQRGHQTHALLCAGEITRPSDSSRIFLSLERKRWIFKRVFFVLEPCWSSNSTSGQLILCVDARFFI